MTGPSEADANTANGHDGERALCRWFALCPNDATGTTSHPVLGEVPTCDRCARFAATGVLEPN